MNSNQNPSHSEFNISPHPGPVFTSTSGRRCSRCSSNFFSSWRKDGSPSTVTVCDKNMATIWTQTFSHFRIWIELDVFKSKLFTSVHLGKLRVDGPLLELCSSLESSKRQHDMLINTSAAHIDTLEALRLPALLRPGNCLNAWDEPNVAWKLIGTETHRHKSWQKKNNDRRIRIRKQLWQNTTVVVFQLHHQHSSFTLISMVSRPSAAAAACFIGCTKACGDEQWTLAMPMHEMHDVKTSITLSWDVWLVWPSKIYTSTTFVWRQLWSWNKISRPQGRTPHPQHRWRPTSLQSWALTTSSSPLHLDQSKAEKHGNRWKSVEMKHIETHKGSFLRLLFHICCCIIWFLRRIRGRSMSKISWKNLNPSGACWNLLPPRNA